MAVTITARDYLSKTASSSDMVSGSFTPAANSLLFVVHNTNYTGGDDGRIDSISGHGTWSSVYSRTYSSNRILEVWACLVGASPSASTVTISGGYAVGAHAEIFEAGGVDVSGGTAASVFGAATNASEYLTSGDSVIDLTLGAFADAGNTTFLACAGPTSITFDGGYTANTLRTVGAFNMRTAYLAAEDNSPSITGSIWVNAGALAFEIKKAASAPSKSMSYYYRTLGVT